MLIKILAVSFLAFGMATSVMAHQSGGTSKTKASGAAAPSADGYKDTTILNGRRMTTVDPGTTGSSTDGDSGMPNSNGNSQGCGGSASNSSGSKPGQPDSDAPGADC